MLGLDRTIKLTLLVFQYLHSLSRGVIEDASLGP